MTLSYRTRKALMNLATTTLILILVAAVLWLCWIVWVGRYMVYHRDGPRLDFSVSPVIPEGIEAQWTSPSHSVKVYYNEPEIQLPVVDKEPTRISGYYIDVVALKSDVEPLIAKLELLEKDTAVMLDLKDTKGRFFYSTSVSEHRHPEIDPANVDRLIDFLLKSDLYVIARIPALRDYQFGLNNVSCGLPKRGGNGSLWPDETGCYWLDPTKEGTADYLNRQVMELRLKGFDEVVFTDFRFPETESIVFEGDKEAALAEAAAQLVRRLSSDDFFLSFQSGDPTFALPKGNARLYLTEIPAAEVSAVVEQIDTDNPSLHILFLTTTHDTRYDEYCVLRPLD